MLNIIGWLGSICLGLCSLPQAYKSYQEGHSDGLSWSFIWLWFFGEIFTLAYVILGAGSLPLICNYIANLGLMSVMLYYKFFPRTANLKEYIIHNEETWRFYMSEATKLNERIFPPDGLYPHPYNKSYPIPLICEDQEKE